MGGVQGEIQFQNIDAWFAKKTALAVGDVCSNESAQFRLGHGARPGEAGHWKAGSFRGDFGIEPGCGSSFSKQKRCAGAHPKNGEWFIRISSGESKSRSSREIGRRGVHFVSRFGGDRFPWKFLDSKQN